MTSPWKTALVTGASSGIGEAFARRLASRGTDLVVVARRQERLESLAGELGDRHAVEVEVLPADLADAGERGRVEDRLRQDARPVDLLVNNAGFGTSGRFADLPVEREDEQIRLNVLALTRLTHAALPGMIARGRGAILNVSSVTAFTPVPNNATYAATKAFVSSFSEALHQETRGTGVTVHAVCPGFTRSEFHETAQWGDDRKVPSFLWLSAERVVDDALAATEKGRAVSVPGLPYKAYGLGVRVVPHAVVRRVADAVDRG
jgi:uncharacterized protein